jgi:hypothetical protein
MTGRTFWWGASFALLPALAGAPGVSYSGMAAINGAWHLMFNRDAPELCIAPGGIVYGMTAGVLVPLFLFGTAARLLWWPFATPRTAPQPSSWKKVAVWVWLQLLTLPISLCFAFAAGMLPWAFLSLPRIFLGAR